MKQVRIKKIGDNMPFKIIRNDIIMLKIHCYKFDINKSAKVEFSSFAIENINIPEYNNLTEQKY